ncbi:M23 family metallopeptidase [Bacillus sp. HMF5848]|uniref:M23 family metallopeptidase n=1 Tax=Bacillus sp. HMF5848 TaxID=2495421 RepID=UPI000F7716C4|nr:M23 family metallopeptidase [Bacillus sp. HMF5848]RSK28010.1 M23 family metallopeptidase [Bacillus sp. HMF5848]
MSKSVEEIKKRIADRNKERKSMLHSRHFIMDDDEKHGQPMVFSSDHQKNRGEHPLFNREMFVLKTFIAVCLVLLVAILYRDSSPRLDQVRNYVSATMEKEFNFATVTAWYENQFGNAPLALLPTNTTVDNEPARYAIPAAGRVLVDFEKDGQGVMIETALNADVETIDEGTVIFAGNKDELGNTVIVQHADGSETWYGHLKSIDVPIYQFVRSGTKVGTSIEDPNGMGQFYFAFKQGDQFIDPIKVIPFD